MRFGLPKAALIVFAAAILALAACGGGSTPNGGLPSQPNARFAGRTHRIHVFHSRSWYRRHRRHRHPANLNPLVYNNGPVETTPGIYLIFWGIASSGDTTHDPDGEAQYLTNFLSHVGDSSWLNTVTQYSEAAPNYTTAYIGSPSSQLLGTYYDSSTPSPYTSYGANLGSEAYNVINGGHLPKDTNADYFVVTATGYDPSGLGSIYCAWHSATTAPGGGLLSYTFLPYLPDVGGSCGKSVVNYASSSSAVGTLDGVSIVAGHELAETQTDPDPDSGWIDLTDTEGGEIGDKCAWTGLQNTQFGGSTLGTNEFPTQPLYSNATDSCVQAYTGASPTPGPTPTPTHVPTAPPTTRPTSSPTPGPIEAIQNGGFESGSLKPWTTCTSGGKLPKAVVSTKHAHGGRYDAYAGNTGTHLEPNGLTSVCQLVTIPHGGQLTVWTFGVSSDRSSKVYQFGALYKPSGKLDKTLYVANENDRRWKKRTFDLSALAGHRDSLVLGVVGRSKDGRKLIGQFVDDISLVGPSAAAPSGEPNTEPLRVLELPLPRS